MDTDSSVNFDLRPTVGFGLGCKFERRATVGAPVNAILEDARESCDSINNRASELEGTINTPQA